MEALKEKLKKDAEILKLEEKTGFPVDVLIMYAAKQAETNNTYREKLENELFLETLLYMAEWFVKEIVESEMTGNSAYVSDEQSFQAMDKWILSSDEERTELINVLKDIRHPKSNRNPFLAHKFFQKENLEKIAVHVKERPLMKMLIEKYYVEPPKVTKKENTKKPAAKKSQKKNSAQISLDMFEQMLENKKEPAEEENSCETEIAKEHAVQENESPENEILAQEAEKGEETSETKDEPAQGEELAQEEHFEEESTENVEEEEKVEEAPKPTEPVAKAEQIDLFSLF